MSVKLPSKCQNFHDYVMYQNVRIPMSDGVELSADIFFPATDGVPDLQKKYSVIMNRSSYIAVNGALLVWPIHMIYYAVENGFVFVNCATRGTHLSGGGPIEPMKNEGWGEHKDGADTIDWITRQPWCDGQVAMTGQSYLGGTIYSAVLSGCEPGLETAVIDVPAMNSSHGGWVYTGDFLDANTAILWAIQMGMEQCQTGHLPEETIAKVMADVPLIGDLLTLKITDLLTKYSLRDIPVARHIPFYQDWLDHRDDPDYFSYNDTGTRKHDFPRPLLFVSSWYDVFGENAINGYMQMVKDAPSKEVSEGHRLIIGPWSHGYVPFVRQYPEADTDLRLVDMEWICRQLRGEPSEYFDENPVTLFVLGENRWRSEKCWPLPDAAPTGFYLHSSGPANSMEGFGTVSTALPEEETPDTYRNDPANPIIIGGGHQVQGGAVDQRLAEVRPDVLVYTGPVLTEDTEVTGYIKAVIYASTSAEDTDFIIKLSDVAPDGSAYNVSEGAVRGRYLKNGRKDPQPLVPEEIYKIEISMHPTSYVFKKGHQFRVDICSSDLNNYDLNPNAFVDLSAAEKKDYVIAANTVYHDAEHPSMIELPILPADRSRTWIDEWPFRSELTGIESHLSLRPVNLQQDYEPVILPGESLSEYSATQTSDNLTLNERTGFVKF